jgi:hypothetical protein
LVIHNKYTVIQVYYILLSVRPLLVPWLLSLLLCKLLTFKPMEWTPDPSVWLPVCVYSCVALRACERESLTVGLRFMRLPPVVIVGADQKPSDARKEGRVS